MWSVWRRVRKVVWALGFSDFLVVVFVFHFLYHHLVYKGAVSLMGFFSTQLALVGFPSHPLLFSFSPDPHPCFSPPYLGFTFLLQITSIPLTYPLIFLSASLLYSHESLSSFLTPAQTYLHLNTKI